MSEHVYKNIKVTGTSTESVEKAITNAIARSNETVRNMRWFVVDEIRGDIDAGNVAHWQVTVEIGFTLDAQ